MERDPGHAPGPTRPARSEPAPRRTRVPRFTPGMLVRLAFPDRKWRMVDDIFGAISSLFFIRHPPYPTGSIQLDRHVVVRLCAGEQQVLPARLIIILVLGLDDGRRPEFAGRDGAGIER